MKIPSNLLRAAMHCQSNDDYRHFLRGVHIKNNHVEACNGHVAVRMTMDDSCERDLIISIKSKVPASARQTVMVLEGETIAKHYDIADNLIAVSVIEVIEGDYPNFDKFIPSESSPVTEIGVNPGYVNLWPKMFKESRSSMKMKFNGEKSVIRLTSTSAVINQNYGDPLFLIMPVK